MDVARLYPQYTIIRERRQQQAPKSPVGFERRSGHDRRTENRVQLDTNLTRDIFEVRNKVSQIQQNSQNSGQKLIQKILPRNLEKTTFSQNITKAAQNNINTDQFIKTAKTQLADASKTIIKSKSDAGAIAGIIGVALGGVLASTLLGPAGIGIALGLGVYFGGKLIKNVVTSHLKDK